MKLKDQVVSLDLAKQLKKLGVKQEGVFAWGTKVEGGYYAEDGEWQLCFREDDGVAYENEVIAFTVAELAIRARGASYGCREDGTFWARLDMQFYSDRRWSQKDTAKEIFEDKNEANCRAKMRIYLMENKIIKK